jgi:hypothetical protein
VAVRLADAFREAVERGERRALEGGAVADTRDADLLELAQPLEEDSAQRVPGARHHENFRREDELSQAARLLVRGCD